MRLSINQRSARVGIVQIHEMFRVLELDAGDVAEPKQSHAPSLSRDTFVFPQTSIRAVEKDLAIVVPCMNEDPDILDGVLRGIPNDCLVILVSNRNLANFEVESKMLELICTTNERKCIHIHQKDPGVAEAFMSAGLSALVEPQDGAHSVRSGKGEAMMIGTALAKVAHRCFIGFVDADNLVPGAVNEYCKVYAAGLHYALYQTGTEDPHAMVRIKWNSKPKVRDGKIVFEKFGRSSRATNYWMNRLLTTLTTASADIDTDTDIDIDHNLDFASDTGEHAMTLDLALTVPFASGYAVEPHQYVHCFSTLSKGERPVQILQIETRNPHVHDCGKGDGHIKRMQAGGLSTIYHSPLAPKELKAEMRGFCKSQLGEVCSVDGEPEECVVYPCLQDMDWEVFKKVLEEKVEAVKSL
ncbi:mannosyl-3-phosphoglycerate synthase [Paraphoma chrysanthemicola]|uniref:Mannosyl-3-phosphoglycerate synthase n=1 Tax=Paraphoma chrysanthemicola TaxID=798071 RepID=A0A8K0QUZ6_9PLEO|nr:mannosyl-3-phosphoglycerate synthase [Paraphoma chrysanthemicola]